MKYDYVKICLVLIVLILLIFRPQIVEFLAMLFGRILEKR